MEHGLCAVLLGWSFCTTSAVCLCGHMGGIMELFRDWCVGYVFAVD